MPQGVFNTSSGETFEFDVELSDPDILAYVRQGLDAGVLAFTVTSLHEVEEQVGGTNPNFYTRESTDTAAVKPNMELVVFVPDKDLARVSDAVFAAGAGVIGQYEQCSYRLAGTGTFFGTDATNPAVGGKGRREEVSEWRLEVVAPEARVGPVVAAMRKAHSYEEPAFDVYPLKPLPAGSGEGRVERCTRSPSNVAMRTMLLPFHASFQATSTWWVTSLPLTV